MKTGVIGLGAMGAHMARNLAKHGFLQTVYNRTQSKAEDLAKESGIGLTTIRRYEIGEGIPKANVSNLQQLIVTLQSAGIELTGDPLKNPGVTLHL